MRAGRPTVGMSAVTIVADLHTKKQFLQRAFFPLGTEVCSEIGLIPPSMDVAASEQNQAYGELMRAAEARMPYLLQRVEWYLQGAEGLNASELPVEERSLPDHLMAFALAVLGDEGRLR